MKYGLDEKNMERLNSVFKEFSEIDEIILYGSRAKGNFRKGSDIDIALKGKKINHSILNKISLKLDDLYLPYILDLNLYHKINNIDLINHINRVGISIYKNLKSDQKSES